MLPNLNDTQAVLLQALKVGVPALACPARLGLLLGLLLEACRALSEAGEVGGAKPAQRGRLTSRRDASGVRGRVRLDTLTCSMQMHSTRCMTASLPTETPLHML